MPKTTSSNAQAATKKDLQKFATKTDLKIVEKNLRVEILKIEERAEGLEESIGYVEDRIERVEYKIERVETKMDRMDKKLDNLQNTLDGFAGNVGKLTEENVIATEHYRNHDLPAIALLRQLQAGKRISKLEATVQST